MYELQPIGLLVFTTLAGKIEPDVFLPPKLVKSDQPICQWLVRRRLDAADSECSNMYICTKPNIKQHGSSVIALLVIIFMTSIYKNSFYVLCFLQTPYYEDLKSKNLRSSLLSDNYNKRWMVETVRGQCM